MGHIQHLECPGELLPRFYTLEGVKELLQKAGLKISKIRSTLLQGPDEPHRIEEPIEGYIKNAGFLCIEAKPGN